MRRDKDNRHPDGGERAAGVQGDKRPPSKAPNAPVFADFDFKDMDRVRTSYRIAKENGRKLVVKLKDCFYLKYISQDPSLGIPGFDDKDTIIYKPKQVSGTMRTATITARTRPLPVCLTRKRRRR